MATVYITNYAGHDYSDAKRYGEIRAITAGHVSFQSLDRMKFECLQGIKDSSPTDWLLFSGAAPIAAVVAMAWLVKHKKVQMLVHDIKKRGTYRELVLTETNIHEIFEVLSSVSTGDSANSRA